MSRNYVSSTIDNYDKTFVKGEVNVNNLSLKTPNGFLSTAKDFLNISTKKPYLGRKSYLFKKEVNKLPEIETQSRN
jgi:hypothetical protein